MKLREFDYVLPEECVAQEPSARRDAARLMVLDRRADRIIETTFDRIGDHLDPGDLLVLNDTRVFPARLRARKPTGGRVDLLLVGRERVEAAGPVWRCLASTSRGLKPGTMLRVAEGFEIEFLGEAPERRVRVRLVAHDGDAEAAVRRHGAVPLPPYIRRSDTDPREALDRERYQTVYAREEGAVAAPTAGLHFTEDLLTALRARGVTTATLTLHVGPGTFQPVRVTDVEDHRLEPEAYRLPDSTARSIAACRERGGRIVAVGTTVVRVLEERSAEGGGVVPGEGWCGAYITPGHRFRTVDALVTNFHLPRTSLLILVCALTGRERLLSAYRTAVGRGYRFYSYGDAMLIL